LLFLALAKSSESDNIMYYYLSIYQSDLFKYKFVCVHMCLFVTEHYNETLGVIHIMFRHIFDGLESRYAKELAVIRYTLYTLMCYDYINTDSIFSILQLPFLYSFAFFLLISLYLSNFILHHFKFTTLFVLLVLTVSVLLILTVSVLLVLTVSVLLVLTVSVTRAQYPSEPVQFTEAPLIIHWGEGMQMLKSAGHEVRQLISVKDATKCGG
jgi:hypothetical protein